jgi:hypothetical protein
MILFGSNADTELLALRSVVDDLPDELGEVRWFHPDRADSAPDVDGATVVVVRLLGGADAWEHGFAQLRWSPSAARPIPTPSCSPPPPSRRAWRPRRTGTSPPAGRTTSPSSSGSCPTPWR